ncbi:MAG: head GIN domain-containing protein [Salinivirgaceae bacterium]|jgi:hypothetical protein
MLNKITIVSIVLLLLFHVNVFAQKVEQLEGFNRIELFGKIEVRLEVADVDSMVIESGTFDVDKIYYSVKDSVLSVKLTYEFPQEIKVRVTIFYKNLKTLEAGGGIKLYNKGALKGKLIELAAKSGSDFDLLVGTDSILMKVNKGAFVRLSGSSRVVNLSTSTGGDYRATELENEVTYAKMSGGSAEVAPKLLLDANVSFGATLKYKDKPSRIKRSEKFGGSISQLEDF